MNHACEAVGGFARKDRWHVPDLELSWPQAAVVAGVLGVAAVALRLARRPRLTAIAVFTQETALVLGLFALWQFAGSFSVMGPDGALARGRWIWHLERAAHLPSETVVQRVFLPHPLLVQAFNLVLRHPALPGPDRVPGLAVRLAPGPLPPPADHAGRGHRRVPAHPASPGRAAADAARHRARGHRRALPPVGLRHAGRVRPRPAFRDAVGARRLGDPGGRHGDHHGPVGLALAGLAVPGRDHAGGGGHGQPLLDGRDRGRPDPRRRAAGPARAGPARAGQGCARVSADASLRNAATAGRCPQYASSGDRSPDAELCQTTPDRSSGTGASPRTGSRS